MPRASPVSFRLRRDRVEHDFFLPELVAKLLTLPMTGELRVAVAKIESPLGQNAGKLIQRSYPEFHWGHIALRVDERFLDWTLEYLRKLPDSHPDRETTRNICNTLSTLPAHVSVIPHEEFQRVRQADSLECAAFLNEVRKTRVLQWFSAVLRCSIRRCCTRSGWRSRFATSCSATYSARSTASSSAASSSSARRGRFAWSDRATRAIRWSGTCLSR